MRTIPFEQVNKAVESLCVAACYELPADVLAALERAAETESNVGAARILGQLVKNARLADRDRIPLCQDSGLTVVFVEQGADVVVAEPEGTDPAPLSNAINAGVAAGYESGYLRKSIEGDPLHTRTNTGSNTPPLSTTPSCRATPSR